MLSPVAACLRLASIVLCLIVTVSFALFAISQTSNASAHQQHELNNELPTSSESATSGAARQPVSVERRAKKGSVRRVIDEVAEEITSPFSTLVDGANSEWLKRGVLLLLALVVYGLGLGYLARAIRVRV